MSAASRHFSAAISSGSPCSSGRSTAAGCTAKGRGWPAPRIATTSSSFFLLPVAKKMVLGKGAWLLMAAAVVKDAGVVAEACDTLGLHGEQVAELAVERRRLWRRRCGDLIATVSVHSVLTSGLSHRRSHRRRRSAGRRMQGCSRGWDAKGRLMR